MPVVINLNKEERLEPSHGSGEQDNGSNTIVTRAGTRIVLGRIFVSILCGDAFIVKDWRSVPGIMASLRAAIIPTPEKDCVDQYQQEACLEMANSLLGVDKPKPVFSAEDAKDLVKHYIKVVDHCPYSYLADRIRHSQRLGPAKFFRYIDRELIV